MFTTLARQTPDVDRRRFLMQGAKRFIQKSVSNLHDIGDRMFEALFPFDSEVKCIMNDLFVVNNSMLALPPWSDQTHGNFDENEVLTALLLGISRRHAAGHFVKIYFLQFIALFEQISPATMFTEETSGTHALREVAAMDAVFFLP